MLRDMCDELAELDSRLEDYNRRIKIFSAPIGCANALAKLKVSVQSQQQPYLPQSVTSPASKTAVNLPPGLDLVPKQRSSGGMPRLFQISKRGDRYLRTLLIHGARAALSRAAGKTDARSQWIGRMQKRRHPNVVAVALANKNVRIKWSPLSKDQENRPAHEVSFN